MGVFREITMTWGGVEYHCTPSMAIIRRCEAKGLRLTRVLHSMSVGEPEVGMLSLLVAEMLRSGGAKVTDDDIGAVLLSGNIDVIASITAPIVEAFVWNADPKKPEALNAA